ncbi:MAG: porin [Bermanella sp.]
MARYKVVTSSLFMILTFLFMTKTSIASNDLEDINNRLETIETLASKFHINGFATVGFTRSNVASTSREGINEDVKFDRDSRAGIRFTADIDDNSKFVTQLVGRGVDHWDAELDWAYLDYQLSENVRLRGGRLVLPFFMISETIDVRYSQPWVRPIDEVYGNVPFTGYEGVDGLYSMELGEINLGFQAWLGTSNGESSGLQFENENMYGLVVTLDHDDLSVRIGHHFQDITIVGFSDFTDVKSEFSVLGVQYDGSRWLLLGEATRFKQDRMFDYVSYYTTLGYRTGRWTPHVTFADFDRDDGAVQQAVTLGLRYDVSANIALKTEVKHVNEDTLEQQGLFDTAPEKSVNILTISIDTVF